MVTSLLKHRRGRGSRGQQEEVKYSHHQMTMVAAQAIAVHLPIGLLTNLGQCFQKTSSILVIDKDVLPAVTAIHQMIDRPFIFQTQLAWHAPTLAQTLPERQ
jgi:hypothetical protein